VAAELISGLDDERAVRILEAVTQARVRRGEQPPEWGDEAAKGLREAFGVPQPGGPVMGGPVTGGDVARAALLVMAEEPETRQAIETMARHMPASRQAFVEPSTVALTAALFVVLQSHVELKRGPDGKWSFAYIKKEAPVELLKPLLEKVVSWLP